MGIGCLIPAFVMFVSVVDVFIVVRLRRRTVIAPTTAWRENPSRQKIVQKQMFRLTLISVLIFFITNLPVGIGKIVFPQNQDLLGIAVRISAIWTGLGWFQSLNFAVSRPEFCSRQKFVPSDQFLRLLSLVDFVPQRVSATISTRPSNDD